MYHEAIKLKDFFSYISWITNFYRHILTQSTVVYIHEDIHQSTCYTHHLLYTDHMDCYSHCRSSWLDRLEHYVEIIKVMQMIMYSSDR